MAGYHIKGRALGMKFLPQMTIFFSVNYCIVNNIRNYRNIMGNCRKVIYCEEKTIYIYNEELISPNKAIL